MSKEDTSITKWCGNESTMEALRRVDIIGDHHDNHLEVEITTSIFTTTAFWGIFDLSVSIDTCDLTICASCSGPTSNDCLSCKLGSFKYLQNPPGPSNCELTCPDRKFKNSLNFNCENCNPICKKCNGSGNNNCLKCENGEILSPFNSGFTCLKNCSESNYENSTLGYCMPCHQTCLTCMLSLKLLIY